MQLFAATQHNTPTTAFKSEFTTNTIAAHSFQQILLRIQIRSFHNASVFISLQFRFHSTKNQRCNKQM